MDFDSLPIHGCSIEPLKVKLLGGAESYRVFLAPRRSVFAQFDKDKDGQLSRNEARGLGFNAPRQPSGEVWNPAGFITFPSKSHP